MTAVLGIDPGVSGGLAVLRAPGVVAHVRAFDPGMTQGDLVNEIRFALDELRRLESRRVFIEKVGYMPTDGGKGAFTFGRIDGLIRGALFMAGYPPREIYPMAWQSRLNCVTGGNKNVSKRKAQELYPGVKVTHSVADALLIAHYGAAISQLSPGA